jgi:hypothetical protein
MTSGPHHIDGIVAARISGQHSLELWPSHPHRPHRSFRPKCQLGAHIGLGDTNQLGPKSDVGSGELQKRIGRGLNCTTAPGVTVRSNP